MAARKPAPAFFVAFCAVFCAALIRHLLTPILDARVPYITYYGAVGFAAWWGGRNPGLFAVLLSVAAAHLAFGHFLSGAQIGAYTVTSLLLFCGVSTLLVWLAESARQAHFRLLELHAENERNLQSISDGFFYLDKEWRYTYLNPTAERYFGKQKADLLGRSAWEVFPEARGTVLYERYHAAVREGKPVHFETLSPITKRWVEIHAHPVTSGLAVYFHDVSDRKEVEARLRQSEARFRSFAETMPDAVWITNAEGRFEYANRRWCEYTGQSAKEYLEADPWGSVVHPEDLDRSRKAWRQASATHQSFFVEHRLRRVIDSSYRWHVSRAEPVSDPATLSLHWFGTSTDIHDRKLAEDALRIRAQVLESMMEGVSLSEEDGTILYTNPAEDHIFGYERGELLGKNVTLLNNYPEPENSERVAAVIQHLRGHGFWEGEWENKRKDGSRFYTWSRITALQLQDRTYWVCVQADITDQRRIQQELQRSERIYRGLGESINYGIWICAPDGRNLYASPSFLKLTGLTQEQCSEFGWGSVLHPEDAEQTIQRWKETARSGAFWNAEHRVRGVDGNYHYVLARGVPIYDEYQQVTCWAGINLDISEQKDVEQKLRQNQELLQSAQQELADANQKLEAAVAERTARLQDTIAELEAVSYSLSHDLRAPLRAISSFSEILQEDYGAHLDTEGQACLSRIIAAAKKLDLLIQDVLIYSRVSKERFTLEPVNLSAFVEQTLATYPVLEAADARLQIEHPLPVVLAHEAFLAQVFTNLAGNAVKFRQPGVQPIIRIHSEIVAGGKVRIWIEDNGIGIDRSHHGRIFEMFGRVYSEKEYEGTGIGLAIVKRAVERMGGRIGLESEIGKGTRFWFTLSLPDSP